MTTVKEDDENSEIASVKQLKNNFSFSNTNSLLKDTSGFMSSQRI
jgi:hypothetical protein